MLLQNCRQLPITFDSDTDSPGAAGTQTRTAIDNLFTFTEPLGRSYSGQWSTSDTFIIIIDNAINAGPPVVGVTTVTPTGTTPILSFDRTSDASSAVSPVLSGDFGTTPSNDWVVDEGIIYYNGGNVGIGTTLPSHLLSVDGIIESTSGGFKFPDGSLQTTASTTIMETDPVFSSSTASSISQTDIDNWNNDQVDDADNDPANEIETWSTLSGIPADIADGDDIGTGDIEGVTAGVGLSGGGTSGSVTLNVDTLSIQNRVTGSCSVGSSISAINEDGTVTCETDDIGDNLWTQSSSDIYYTDGNVGIGTASPNTLLHLLSNTEANLTIQSSTGDATIYIDRGATAQDSGIVFSDQGTAKLKIGLTESGGSFYIKNEESGENIFSVSSGGSVGVYESITAPDYKLQDVAYSRHIFYGNTIETQGNGARINVIVSMTWKSSDDTWNSERKMFYYINEGDKLKLKRSATIYDTGNEDMIATVTGNDITFSFPAGAIYTDKLIEVFGISITGVG